MRVIVTLMLSDHSELFSGSARELPGTFGYLTLKATDLLAFVLIRAVDFLSPMSI
jgi:hypothetical protein